MKNFIKEYFNLQGFINCPICKQPVNTKKYYCHPKDYSHYVSVSYFGITFNNILVGFDDSLNISLYENFEYSGVTKYIDLNNKIDINYQTKFPEIISKLQRIYENLLFL